MRTIILGLLSQWYRWAMHLRNNLFDKGFLATYTSSIPVISVGNLTVGGNGKTMVVVELCRQACAQGFRPVILSRGYGGSVSGPYLVNHDSDSRLVGDEPLMLSRLGGNDWSVVVAKSRVKGAKFIEEHKLGTLVILDDGFQHRWLNRSVNLIAINISGDTAVEEFLAGSVLPRGRFREDRDQGLQRATHVLLVSRSPRDNDKNVDLISNYITTVAPHIGTVHVARYAVQSVSNNEGQLLDPSVGPVNVFCGLGNPQGFLSTLCALGYTINESVVLGDHATISPELLSRLEQFPVICTEKDYVKLANPSAHIYRVTSSISSPLFSPEGVFKFLQ